MNLNNPLFPLLVVLILLVLPMGNGCGDSSSSSSHTPVVYSTSTPAGGNPDFTVLVYTRTLGYVHASTPDGVAAVQKIGNQNNFAVDATEDPTLFTDQGLAKYRVIIFLNTVGDVLNDTQQGAMERFIQAGGAFVGIHSATSTEYQWPYYKKLIGALFKDHPPRQDATVDTVNSTHPSTKNLPTRWSIFDEWNNYHTDPTPEVDVLLTVDESTYTGGTMGANHPIAWSHTNLGSRSWYTGIGHFAATYSDPNFVEHLKGGILWAAGVAN